MHDETRDFGNSSVRDEECNPDSAEAGVALVLQAEDHGDWKTVAEWLVRHPEAAGEVGDFLAAQKKVRQVVEPFAVSAPVPSGATVDRFVLGEEIGRGGAAVVYRAFDSRLQRDVALKLVRTGEVLTGERNRFRFQHEALIVASLRHPNIVTIHDLGEDGEVSYIAMPLMTGGSLADRLKKLGPDRRLSAMEAATLVRDIALGVHHAHQRGLIHRDLKPGNILLDEAGVPHVADFGLARQVDVTTSISGSIAGTPIYMAPEQARGEPFLTTAVDVHALGVILFELLTGRPPFGGGDLASILRSVIEDAAPPVRALRPDVPRDLETICSRCLRKDSQDRYPSAQALAENLTKFLNGDSIDDRRGWVWETVSRALGWQRRTLTMGTWSLCFWGAASTVFAMAVMQAAILLDAPLWVSQVAIAYYLIAWLGLMWGFLVMRRDALNPVERASTAIHFGAKFACVGVLPVHLWLHDGNPVYALPSFMAIVGLAVFVHGITYWGRFYLVGLGFFAVVAVMPLISVAYWPGVYGLLLGLMQFVMGFHLRSIHRSAEAIRQVG